MTTTHYEAPDKIVTIVTTTDDDRYPRNDSPMVVIQLQPQDHSRCRQQWGGVTVMPTHDEIRGLLTAIKACEPAFEFSYPVGLRNKPDSRKRAWQQRNRQRVALRR